MLFYCNIMIMVRAQSISSTSSW